MQMIKRFQGRNLLENPYVNIDIAKGLEIDYLS